MRFAWRQIKGRVIVSKAGDPVVLLVGDASRKDICLQIAGLLLGQRLAFVLPPGYDLRFLNIERNGKVIAESGICTSRIKEPSFGAIRVDNPAEWQAKAAEDAAGQSAVEKAAAHDVKAPVKPLRKARQRRQQ